MAQFDGDAAGKRCHGAEVEDAHLPSGSSMKFRVRVAVHHLEPARCVVGQFEEAGAHQVALLDGAFADDLRQRDALHPLGDHDLGSARDDCGHHEVRVVAVGLGEGTLVVGFEAIVEFHLGALDEFVDHATDVGAGESCRNTDTMRFIVLRSARSASSAPGTGS